MADGIIGYPFDSILTFDEEGNPTYDRAVPSKVLKTLISKLFTTGVMPNPSNNLLVTAGTEGMTTIVEEGFCVIEGGLKLIVEPQTMMHQASDTNYDRIDTVVMRWDNNDNVRHCGLFVVAGTPAISPVRPTLTREGSIYEIGLADVLIKANSTVISANRITDTRYDDERCGVVRSISEYDTTYIYQQVQADLADFKENEQADFVAWFETIRGILDEEVAGHLQLEIDDLKALIKPIGEATDASNTWTAVEAKKEDKIARLQMNANGDLILFQSVDNGETWTQKEIGEKPTVRWNPQTYYYEVLENGQWYQDRYFNPHWNGWIYNLGTYNSNYFGNFVVESTAFATRTIKIGGVGNPFTLKIVPNGMSSVQTAYMDVIDDVTLPEVRSTSTIQISGTNYLNVKNYSSAQTGIYLVAEDNTTVTLYNGGYSYDVPERSKTDAISVNVNVGTLAGHGAVHLKYRLTLVVDKVVSGNQNLLTINTIKLNM